MPTQKILLIIILCASVSWMQAQITLTNATFPVAGDTLKTANDFSPDGITIDPPGGPYTWDYSSFSADSRQVLVYQAAANGAAYASFPTAELVTISDVGAEAYFDVTATQFANLGFSGGDITEAFPFVTEVIFTPPIVERRAPTNFFDLHQANSEFHFAVSLADLPAGLLDSLGIPSGLLDSIRLRVNLQSLEVINAYGTLTIPGGTYNVLRQQSNVYTSTGLDVHSTFLGWIDVGSLGIPLDGLGTDTTTTYSYLSNTEKEPIAVMTMAEPNGLVPAQAAYKDNGINSAVNETSLDLLHVSVTPNPFTDHFTIDLIDLKPDTYSLFLFDVLGHVVMTKEINSQREVISLTSNVAGIYHYQLRNGKNAIVAVGKVSKQ